jgi:hypothetical protein
MIDQQILTDFYRQRPEFDVRANDSFIIEKATKPLTIESLWVAADQLRDKLVLAPAFASAWHEFTALNPNRNNAAERNQFAEQMREKEVQLAEKQEYESLITELGRKELRGTSLQDLRNLAAIQRENKRRLSLSRSQLGELARKETGYEKPSEWPKLPLRMVPRGQVTSIAIDANYLNNIAKYDKYEFARLCKLYGCDAVDTRRGIK